jgi:hypothetical protein
LRADEGRQEVNRASLSKAIKKSRLNACSFFGRGGFLVSEKQAYVLAHAASAQLGRHGVEGAQAPLVVLLLQKRANSTGDGRTEGEGFRQFRRALDLGVQLQLGLAL